MENIKTEDKLKEKQRNLKQSKKEKKFYKYAYKSVKRKTKILKLKEKLYRVKEAKINFYRALVESNFNILHSLFTKLGAFVIYIFVPVAYFIKGDFTFVINCGMIVLGGGTALGEVGFLLLRWIIRKKYSSKQIRYVKKIVELKHNIGKAKHAKTYDLEKNYLKKLRNIEKTIKELKNEINEVTLQNFEKDFFKKVEFIEKNENIIFKAPTAQYCPNDLSKNENATLSLKIKNKK